MTAKLYKPWDRVKIRSDLKVGEKIGTDYIYTTKQDQEIWWTFLTIKKIFANSYGYLKDESGAIGSYVISDEMIEYVLTDESIRAGDPVVCINAEWAENYLSVWWYMCIGSSSYSSVSILGIRGMQFDTERFSRYKKPGDSKLPDTLVSDPSRIDVTVDIENLTDPFRKKGFVKCISPDLIDLTCWKVYKIHDVKSDSIQIDWVSRSYCWYDKKHFELFDGDNCENRYAYDALIPAGTMIVCIEESNWFRVGNMYCSLGTCSWLVTLLDDLGTKVVCDTKDFAPVKQEDKAKRFSIGQTVRINVTTSCYNNDSGKVIGYNPDKKQYWIRLNTWAIDFYREDELLGEWHKLYNVDGPVQKKKEEIISPLTTTAMTITASKIQERIKSKFFTDKKLDSLTETIETIREKTSEYRKTSERATAVVLTLEGFDTALNHAIEHENIEGVKKAEADYKKFIESDFDPVTFNAIPVSE